MNKNDPLRSTLAEMAAIAAAAQDGDRGWLTELKTQAESLAALASDGGLIGLADVCMFFGEQLERMLQAADAAPQERLDQCTRLVALIEDYLGSDAAAGAAGLATALTAAEWPQPLQKSDAAVLQSMLEGDAPDGATVHEHRGSSSEPLVREIIGILQTELQALARTGIAVSRKLAAKPNDSHADDDDASARYVSQLERFRAVAGDVGIDALGEIVAHVLENFRQVADRGTDLSAFGELLVEWPEHAAGCLDELGQAGAGMGLLEFMGRPEWPVPLVPAVRERLGAALGAVTVSDADPVAAGAAKLRRDDLSLQLPEDIVPALLEALLQELPEQCEKFAAAVQTMVDGSASLETLRTAQRVAHTIKGAANTVGVRGVANFTHLLEELLIAYVDRDCLPPPSSVAKLLRASDCLQQMSDCLLGRDVEPDDAYEILMDALQDFDTAAQSRMETDPVTSVAETPPRPATAATAGVAEAQSAGQLRIPARLVDELYRLAGESIIHTAQVRERMQRIQKSLKELGEQYALIQGLSVELDERAGWQERRPKQAMPAAGDFDPLEMEQFHELQSMANRLQEIAQDNHALRQALQRQCSDLTDLVLAQERLHVEQSELVGRCRMLPVAELASRLQRAVRQACRFTGKQVEFALHGADTLVDSYVLNTLADPLMHVLRNAVDHGIEPAETRLAAGKAASGTVTLSFARIGNDIVVRCEDDGAGLDFATIEAIARHRSLLDGTQTASEEQLKGLLMQPGFSTRAESTQTSGRGIGMAAVSARIGELKGTVGMNSEAGCGCTVEMKIPVSLISVAGVLVTARGRTVAITNRGIGQMVAQVAPSDDDSCRVDGTNYTATVLADSLYGTAGDGSKPAACAALIVDNGVKSEAVLVDEILEPRNFVVKSLGDYVPPSPGLLGATLLGDGSVVPVLDLQDWMDASGQEAVPADAASQLEMDASLKRVLIVDDSISTRRSLSQLLQDAGYETVTASDGLDALDKMAAASVDLLLVDLEMPRMNGLELTRRLRAEEADTELPVVMLTSRSTAKHRRKAINAGVDVYLTKPYTEEALLETVESLLVRQRAAGGHR